MNLNELAASLSVSPASVSIVRLGRPGVSAKTRRRIQIALEENGFNYKEFVVPGEANMPAPDAAKIKFIRLLKYHKSSLLTDKNEGFVDAIIDSIDAHARAEGYSLVINGVSHAEYPSFAEGLERDECAGILVIATEMDRGDILRLSKAKPPVVILDSDHVNIPFCTVTMNNRDLAYEAVSRLIRAGGGEVGYVCSQIRTGNFIGRANGYREALEDHGMTRTDEIIFSLTPSVAAATEDMLALLDAGRRVPCALFAENDILAIGAMRALEKRGYKIPQDVRVIGVDNTPLSQIVSPSLSTMQISRAALGQFAFTALLKQIADPESERTHIYLSSHLITRESAPDLGEPEIRP